MSGVRVLHLDEVPPRPGAGTGADWLALRATLGVRAVGINAYRAPAAGIETIERHTEDDHEELYVVLAGRATFTVGGETIDAPAGTVVLVAEPALERVAVSEEPGTTILAVGGPPRFEPSDWEEGWLEHQPV